MNIELNEEEINTLYYALRVYMILVDDKQEEEDVMSLSRKLSSYIDYEYEMTADWECSSGTLHAYNENCDCNDF